MSALRQAMLDQMLLKGFSERTQKSYINAVELLAGYYHQSPDSLSRSDLQNWFLYLVKERQLSPASCRLYLNAIRFLYLHVLHWHELQLTLNTPKCPQKIPDLLSPTEVSELILQTENKKYRTMFQICYACGLRVSEVVSLKVKHIHGEQHYCQVVQGKGGKDRQVPLSATLLFHLRTYWQEYHPSLYLFAGRNVEKPMSISSVQKVFTRSKQSAGIEKNGGIHSLRHAFATHQLSAGMPIHQLKTLLGHQSLQSTLRYLHWQAEVLGVNNDLLAPFEGRQAHD